MPNSTDQSHIPQFTWPQAIAWRLARHHLVTRAAPTDLVRVVADIGGLHAQVTSSAELSLWARIEGLDRAAFHDALWKERSLVKLWATRGTLYLLPAAEIGVWLGAIGTYTNFGNTGIPRSTPSPPPLARRSWARCSPGRSWRPLSRQ